MENIFKVLFGLLLLSMLVFPGAAAPVTNGLVASYNGNITGNVLLDESGNYNNGYLKNAIQGTLLSTGANCVSFSGSNSQANILNNASTNITSEISIEFIGSINEFSSYGAIVSKYSDENGTGWYLSCRSDPSLQKIVFGMFDANGVLHHFRSDISLEAGQVYDIVVTYDGNIVHVYVNGVDSSADESPVWAVPMSGNNYNTSIAYAENGLNYLNCDMLAFRLYNRALTSSEVQQNYQNDKWRYVPDISSDIIDLKKKAYGDCGLPRYMGSHAMSQSESGVNVVDSNLSSLGSVSMPYYQDNEGAETDYNLLNSSISGVKWKNYYAPGSSASLSFSGDNRTRLENLSLLNNSLHLSNSVTYTEDTLVTKEAVPVTGNAFQFYGDGLNTISENAVQGYTVQAYTDNGEIQNDCIFNSSGSPIYNYYQNRTAGTTRNNSVDLPLSSPQLTPMPCPSGYLGSLSFAIHADAQDPDSLKTMMYGTNDITDPEDSTQGYIGHELICTWAAFAASSDGAGVGFDNVLFKSILDDMYAHDFEIVPHNVIGWAGEGNPTRDTTGYYLSWYASNYTSRNWIDHGLNGGNRNTGLKSLGLDKDSSQYYIGDLLREHEVQYAWAYQDQYGSPERGLSTSRIQSLGLPYDIVWTNTNFTWDDGTPMYEWTSTWAPDKTALNYFNNTALQNMIDSYGVCFWHDYTAYNGEAFEDYYYYKDNHTINEKYDNLLLNMSEQKKAGRLWNPTVSQYIDYWRAACNVECKCTGQDTYTLINHNSETVSGYAMRVTGPYSVKLDGNDLDTKMNGNDTVFWMDLSPGTHLLTLVRA